MASVVRPGSDEPPVATDSSVGARRIDGLERLGPERLQILYDLSRAFAAQTAIDDLVPLVVRKCRDALPSSAGVAVMLPDAERNELSFRYFDLRYPARAERLVRVRVPIGESLAGTVLRSGVAELIEDFEADPRHDPVVPRLLGLRIGSMLNVPLRGREGVIGVLSAITERGMEPFSAADLAFLSPLAASVGVAIENAELYDRLRQSEERLRGELGILRGHVTRAAPDDAILGSSPEMLGVLSLSQAAAGSPLAVLIEGETGTGKELIARRVHRASARAGAPFIAVNCAAFPEGLLESELFGHRRGAFTGADRDRAGLFEVAAGGTVFLDEVGETPLAMQAKLLRVLQEGEILRLGDHRPRKIDARIVSATNLDLEGEVRAGRFRADLFYRLAAFPIRVPPLRERRGDIAELAEHFLRQSLGQHGKRISGLDASALKVLVRHDWPGNVRQLKNELARAVALARDGEAIGAEHLALGRDSLAAQDERIAPQRVDAGGPALGARAPASQPGEADPLLPLREARCAFEARFIAEVLAEHGGNVTRAARALRLSRVALHKKLAAYGLR